MAYVEFAITCKSRVNIILDGGFTKEALVPVVAISVIV